MPRFFLRLSFKGTAYAGWQIQENAITVQEKLNIALTTLSGHDVMTVGCGRTDTGVHAKQFYLHFDAQKQPGNRFLYQLNSILPSDIAVQEIIPVGDEQHARYDATERCYEYFIITAGNPFLNEYTHFTYPEPDIDLMNKACTCLIQKGDFSTFSKSNTQVKTNICDVRKAIWEKRNNMLVFTITADRFLRGMVRAIVGTLLDVGNTKIRPEEVASILESRNRSEAGATVAASGLYLSAIRYPFLKPVPVLSFPG